MPPCIRGLTAWCAAWCVPRQTASPSSLTIAGRAYPRRNCRRFATDFTEAATRRRGGSGLGLAIADLAMKRLGGEVYLENRREGGLRAELRLADKVRTDCSENSAARQRREHPVGSISS